MSGAIKHYILTRFNVALPGRAEAIRLKPGWLDARFDLFRDFCLPGVASQTRRDFEWIIYFDAETPRDYMARIEGLRDQFPFRIEYTALFEMGDICRQLVAERGEADWLLTTRLDSDDILASSFTERLRREMTSDKMSVFNFPVGLVLSVQGQTKRVYADRDLSGPFASLLEPFTDTIHTVWAKQHRHLDELAPIQQGGTEPAWLQVVHGGNLANHVRGKRVRPADHAGLFPYLAALPPDDAGVFRENLILTPLRRTKEMARQIAKKLMARR